VNSETDWKEETNMSSRKTFYAAMLMAALLVVATGCSMAATAASSATPPNRTITVVGTGKAFGTPDVARVTVGIETRNESVQEAADDNDAKMSALLEAIAELGIDKKDIQTSNYSIYTDRNALPGAEMESSEESVVYVVNNQVTVTVRDLEKLGDVLDGAVAAGANNVYGIYFTVDDPSALESEARANAVADAKARAESLAELAGVEVGDVLSISEVIGGGTAVPVMEAARGMGQASVPIEVGELEVGMSVQVTYAIG
jgi:uncharacterized protein YggE